MARTRRIVAAAPAPQACNPVSPRQCPPAWQRCRRQTAGCSIGGRLAGRRGHPLPRDVLGQGSTPARRCRSCTWSIPRRWSSRRFRRSAPAMPEWRRPGRRRSVRIHARRSTRTARPPAHPDSWHELQQRSPLAPPTGRDQPTGPAGDRRNWQYEFFPTPRMTNQKNLNNSLFQVLLVF